MDRSITVRQFEKDPELMLERMIILEEGDIDRVFNEDGIEQTLLDLDFDDYPEPNEEELKALLINTINGMDDLIDEDEEITPKQLAKKLYNHFLKETKNEIPYSNKNLLRFLLFKSIDPDKDVEYSDAMGEDSARRFDELVSGGGYGPEDIADTDDEDEDEDFETDDGEPYDSKQYIDYFSKEKESKDDEIVVIEKKIGSVKTPYLYDPETDNIYDKKTQEFIGILKKGKRPKYDINQDIKEKKRDDGSEIDLVKFDLNDGDEAVYLDEITKNTYDFKTDEYIGELIKL
mgnify:FL=1|tara:strand:+ start:663 stop:1529 length:867 start_codon:yes stop_codon:yes gene_type:complete